MPALFHFVMIFPLFPRIAEAANYHTCLLSATSPLLSLEVSPPPALARNLSGSPLITVQLRHRLVSVGHAAGLWWLRSGVSGRLQGGVRV